MIRIARSRRGVNILITGLVTALLALGPVLLAPATTLAATADPTYTCGNYGGSAYNGCDTTINSGSSSSSGTSSTTTTPTTTTTTPASNTIVNTSGSSQTGSGSVGKMSIWRKLLFALFLLIFLVALWWFFILFKRRKRKDDEKPPTSPESNLWK